MPKVICSLQNASTLINGVDFKAHGEVMLSEEISDAVASQFEGIKGYEIVHRKKTAATDPNAGDTATQDVAKKA